MAVPAAVIKATRMPKLPCIHSSRIRAHMP